MVQAQNKRGIGERIVQRAFDLLSQSPSGVRWADLVRVVAQDGSFNRNTVADWLKNDLEECTKAIPLGGNRFRDRWGTPDVIGKRESKKSDILQAETEIVSAEIKLDTNQLVTAFGQACAYRLFSHKSYLAGS